MTAWDRQTPGKLRKARDTAVRRQVGDLVGPLAPFWREQFTARSARPSQVNSVAALAKVPAVGERDVCPDADPAGAARLVVQTDERGFAVHALGPQFRGALVRRLWSPKSYRRGVDAVIRPTSFHLGGFGFEFPLASTRGDLDLIARAGARLWRVLGLGRQDVVASLLPQAATVEHVGLSLAALGAGAPALFPGASLPDAVHALRMMPVTVLVAPADSAAEWVDALAEAGADLSHLTSLLLVGIPTEHQRAAAYTALGEAGRPAALALAVWGPRDGRVLYGECRESVRASHGAGLGSGSAGLHTYPDLEVLQLVDPETGESVPDNHPTGGELVLTQLGFWGSALLRWRTGALLGGPLEKSACPACHRTVARIPLSTRGEGLVPAVTLRGADTPTRIDLRAVAGALAGRGDLAGWRIQLSRSARDGAAELLVQIAPSGADAEAGQTATGVYRDVRRAAGLSPTQVVVDPIAGEPFAPGPHRISPRILVEA